MSIIDPGMLRAKYVVYIITSKSKNTTVERRYSDFDNLRRELIKLYPGYIIPSIPKKKVGKGFENAFLQKRMTALQSFLNELMIHPLLKSSELVLAFLTVSNKEWEAKTKSFAKTLPPKEVSQYRTIEGNARIELSNDIEHYCDRIVDLNGTLEDSYRNLKRANKVIGNDFERLSESVLKAGIIYTKLGETYSELNCKNQTMLFMFMGDLHKKLGETYRTLKESFTNNFSNFYSFYCRECQALGELLDTRKIAFENYNSNEKKLLKKKESLFEQKNIIKWKLDPTLMVTVEDLLKNKNLACSEMLPDESLEVLKLKMLYSYYTNKCVEEYIRVISKNKLVIKEYFETVPSIYIEREMCLQRVWTELFKKLRGLTLEEENIQALISI
jgi:hypothetical protein